MKASDFREWIGKITQLSRGQKEQAKHRLGGMVQVARSTRKLSSPVAALQAAFGRENQFQLLTST